MKKVRKLEWFPLSKFSSILTSKYYTAILSFDVENQLEQILHISVNSYIHHNNQYACAYVRPNNLLIIHFHISIDVCVDDNL